jgi:lipoprotein-releasing system permease protein
MVAKISVGSSLFGALSGIVLGLLLCYIQQRFGIIS